MTWVFLCITLGATGFLIFIIIDYLRVAGSLRPKVELVQREIQVGELRIENERKAIQATKEASEVLQKEIDELEKELHALAVKVEEYQQRERRRNPTKFRLEE